MGVLQRNTLLMSLAGLAALVLSAYLVYSAYTGQRPDASLGDKATTTAPIPPYTDKVKAALAKSQGFQVLISYTSRGFQPKNVQVKKGDTVRFTNNSSEPIWIAASGDALYPSDVNGCGSSALDSCMALQSGEFFEFTFLERGTWKYVNSLYRANSGSIEVR